MGVVDSGYYERSLALIDSLHGKLPVAVFSDQPELVAQMTCFRGDRFEIVISPQNTRAIDTMIAMSEATALIIGNSTFSWWAAFIGDKPGRTVVAPRPWLDSKTYDERDLLPLHWYTVGR